MEVRGRCVIDLTAPCRFSACEELRGHVPVPACRSLGDMRLEALHQFVLGEEISISTELESSSKLKNVPCNN